MKGLSFSEPMVRAWMEGRKTVTRRMMNPQPGRDITELLEGPPGSGVFLAYIKQKYGQEYEIKPRYLPGETVYIKEVWGLLDADFHPVPLPYRNKPYYAYAHIAYKADHVTGNDGPERVSWKSPMMMPSWAARSHARIISVRPERVQDITEKEAIREGIERETAHGKDLGWKNYLWHGHFGSYGMGNKKSDAWPYQYSTYKDAVGSFSSLWDSIHPGSWDKNPWVWRIELEKM